MAAEEEKRKSRAESELSMRIDADCSSRGVAFLKRTRTLSLKPRLELYLLPYLIGCKMPVNDI